MSPVPSTSDDRTAQPGTGPSVEGEDPEAFRALLTEVTGALPKRINATPENVEAGVAKLVLTLVELLRQVLEHQAIRRMESGTLSVEEEERLGIAFLRLQERVAELRDSFGLSEEDLNVDLGPLGRLL